MTKNKKPTKEESIKFFRDCLVYHAGWIGNDDKPKWHIECVERFAKTLKNLYEIA